MKASLPLALISAAVAGSAVPRSTSAQDDWAVVSAGYTRLEWVAGLSGETPDNGNEWNDADGKPATEAELSEPHSVMADLAGNLYIADKNAHAIRKIDTNGIIHTVAGTNEPGFTGDGVATEQRLDGPQHAYVLPDGTFYILDTGNRRIRRVDRSGEMTTVIVESASLSRGLWVSRDESLIYYCTDKTLRKWTPAVGSGPGITLAAGFTECGNIDVAQNGDIYVTDRGSSRVYRVPPDNDRSTPPVVVAGLGGTEGGGPGRSGEDALTIGFREARGIAFHPAGGYFLATHHGGDIWYIDTANRAWMFIEGNNDNIFFPDPQPLPSSKKLISEPRSVSVALNGDVLIAANDSGYIRRAPWSGPPLARPVWTEVTGSPAQGFTLRWSMTPGNWFQVEAGDGSGLWEPLEGGRSETGTGELAIPASPDSPRRFFRLREYRAWPN